MSLDAFKFGYLNELEKLAILETVVAAPLAASTAAKITAAATATLAGLGLWGKGYKFYKGVKTKMSEKMEDINKKIKEADIERKKRAKSNKYKYIPTRTEIIAGELGKGILNAPKALSEQAAEVA